MVQSNGFISVVYVLRPYESILASLLFRPYNAFLEALSCSDLGYKQLKCNYKYCIFSFSLFVLHVLIV